MVVVKDEISTVEFEIIRQIEYYFGDVNLIKDKFMRENIKENDGWLTMETMLKFKRLSALSSDVKEIMKALKKSSTGLMEVSEAEEKIRRSPSLPVPDNTEEAKKELESRTCYAKGYDKENTKLDDLLVYYREKAPSVVNINMRTYVLAKTKERKFKGSVFLTFKTKEDCDKFVSEEKPVYKEKELERVCYQKEYQDEKNKEFEEKRSKQKDEKNKKQAKVEDIAEKIEMQPLPKGTVIKITGLGGEITREDIKDKLHEEFKVNIDKEGGDIAFITYQKGEKEAQIRFKVENYGKDLLEKINKVEKVVVKDMEVKITLLEGDEETAFLEESLKDMKNMRAKNKNHKRKFGGRGGGHGGKRSRH